MTSSVLRQVIIRRVAHPDASRQRRTRASNLMWSPNMNDFECEFDDSAILRKLEEVLRKLETLRRALDEVASDVRQVKSRQ